MPTSPVEDDSSEKSSNKDTDSKNGDVKDEGKFVNPTESWYSEYSVFVSVHFCYICLK